MLLFKRNVPPKNIPMPQMFRIDPWQKGSRHRCKECYISSLVCRKSPRLQAKTNKVNDVLRDLCTIDGFVFIDTANLSDCDICEDLLHLSYSGTSKLANNFIGAINRNLEKSSF